jgi:two-component system sensor histidine kinase PhoQ
MIKWLEGKCHSIRYRLLFAFTLLFISVLLLLGLFLDHLYSVDQKQHLQQKLQFKASLFTHCLSSGDTLGIAKFDYCVSVQKPDGQTVFYIYNSLHELAWGSPIQTTGNPTAAVIKSLLNLKTISLTEFSASFWLVSEIANNSFLLLKVSQNQFQSQIDSFRLDLFGLLASLLGLLIASFVYILHRGLQPLDKMVIAIADIASGKSKQIEDEYASEFVAMRDGLNNVLNAERIQRERYRNTLADLAHSLKTPLAVMQGAASENLDYAAYLRVAGDQIRRMDQIIQYQLTRAVKSIGDGAKVNIVQLTPIIERILSALGKVYRDKEVKVILNLERGIEINADERDLMEMFGNMLENAFKYCRSEIAVSVYSDQDNVFIILEDDGAGVSENMRNTILERGERADTSAAPGQGIGLSVSVDILSSYNCRLEVEDSFSLGGAKFSITFPLH